MEILNTKHKRKSIVITAILLMLFVLGILNCGMQYLDPPEEYGLAINFGNSELESGTFVEKAAKKQEIIKEVKKTSNEIITDDTRKDVPVVEKEIEDTETSSVQENPKPKPSKETQDALNNLLNGNSSDGKPKGEGDDKEAGVKGKDAINSSKYYDNTGIGSNGNYNLAGRNALSKPKVQPNCEEEGTVVVSIQVDKNGKVVFANSGIQGTTNSADCLKKAAKQSALRTKWNTDNKAPTKQIGTIIYKFSLSK